MNRKLILFLFCFLFGAWTQALAAKVDTIQTFSPSMNKKIKAVVILPDNYKNGKEYPVVYLLHGFGGTYADWIKRAPALDSLSDLHNQIIVCPDGSTSWYFDSPKDPTKKYETYVSKELVQFIDQKYKTVKDRKGRAITGLSMGGHGALYLAFKHQDTFGAAGSMSGGVDIRPFPLNWKLSENLGTYAEQPENWEKNTVYNMVHLLNPKSLALIVDCGTEDFFFNVNQNLHAKLLERNISHDYITRPGAHNWPYWSNAIDYQLLFFSRFFKG
jgi:S-formylglutathione hydrolase FrmB